MPKTWDLFSIAVSKDAEIGKFAFRQALDEALQIAAATGWYDWPPHATGTSLPRGADGPPMPILKAFQRARSPPVPVAQEAAQIAHELPKHTVITQPTSRSHDEATHWYTDDSKSWDKELTAAMVKLSWRPWPDCPH
jgi:hypothetical protein